MIVIVAEIKMIKEDTAETEIMTKGSTAKRRTGIGETTAEIEREVITAENEKDVITVEIMTDEVQGIERTEAGIETDVTKEEKTGIGRLVLFSEYVE